MNATGGPSARFLGAARLTSFDETLRDLVLMHGRFPQPLPLMTSKNPFGSGRYRSTTCPRRRNIPCRAVPTMRCARGHPDQYSAIQGWQKLPEAAVTLRRSNGKFGKCLEMNF